MYVSPIGQVVDAFGIQHHQYADDLMLYCALTASQLDDLSPLVRCSDAVSLWFHQNALLLNLGKTEAVLFATRQRLVGVEFNHTINVASADIQFSEVVKLLGITLDTSLSFDQHVTNVVRACNFHLRSLQHLQPSLTFESEKLIIATASCTALRSRTSTISRRCRRRWLASCIRLPSRRAPQLCANSCIGYRSDNGSRTS